MQSLTPERWHTLYVSRKEGFPSIEDAVDASIRGLENYIKNSKRDWLQQQTTTLITRGQREQQQKLVNRNEKKNKCMVITSVKCMKLHGRRAGHGYKRETSREISSHNSINNVIRSNYLKVKINNTQQKNKCRWCGEKDERVNYMLSGCSQLAQNDYKTRHHWVERVIHRELCKRLKFDYIIKWYKHKADSVLENEMHKILCDFEV